MKNVSLFLASALFLSACQKHVTLPSREKNPEEGLLSKQQQGPAKGSPTPVTLPEPPALPVVAVPLPTMDPVDPAVFLRAPENAHIAPPAARPVLVPSGDPLRDLLLYGQAPNKEAGCFMGMPWNEHELANPYSNLGREMLGHFVRHTSVQREPLPNYTGYSAEGDQFSEGARVCIVRSSEPSKNLYCGVYTSAGTIPEGRISFQPWYEHDVLYEYNGYHEPDPWNKVSEGRPWRNILRQAENRNGGFSNKFRLKLVRNTKGLLPTDCNASGKSMSALPYKMSRFIRGWPYDHDQEVAAQFDSVRPENQIKISKLRAQLGGDFRIFFAGVLHEGAWGGDWIPPHIRTARKFIVLNWENEKNYYEAGFDGERNTLYFAQVRSGLRQVLAETPFFDHSLGQASVYGTWVEVFGPRVKVTALTHTGKMEWSSVPLSLTYTFPGRKNLSEGLVGIGASVPDPIRVAEFAVYGTTDSNPRAKLAFVENFDATYGDRSLVSVGWRSTRQFPNRLTGIMSDGFGSSDPRGFGPNYDQLNSNAVYVWDKTRVTYEARTFQNALVTAFFSTKRKVALFVGNIGAAMEDVDAGTRKVTIFREDASGRRTILGTPRTLRAYRTYGDSPNVNSYEGHFALYVNGPEIRAYWDGELMTSAINSPPRLPGHVAVEAERAIIDSLQLYDI